MPAAGPSASRPTLDLASFAPALGQTCEEYRVTYRERLANMVRAGEGGLRVVSMHARILDGLLGALYCASDAAARSDSRLSPQRMALVAVGGYGRSQLGLESDLDVVLLCEDPGNPAAVAVAEALLYPLWDLGLEIGHAVRSVEGLVELAREDLRTATTLLDLRPVAGDRSLVEELGKAARRQIFDRSPLVLLDKLEEERRARHERFGGSRYLLEPEIKNGCGGLRDLDVLSWAAGVRWGARSLDDTVRCGALLHREAQELEQARELLWRLRNQLHVRAGRRHDRMTFEDQEELAPKLGYLDGATPEPGPTLGVEKMMQAYYRAARTIEVSMERMLERAHHVDRKSPAPAVDLGDGVLVWDGHLTLRESADLDRDPGTALRLYRHVTRRQLPVYPYARDAMARAVADATIAERLRASSEAAELFLEHLVYTGEAPLRQRTLLAELHEVGVLLAMIPEFQAVTGRVQHDVYHVYTVDVHSVAAVDRLRAVLRGDLASELPLPTRLATETPRLVPLFLAVLLHDIGKGHGRDHSARGAEMAGPIATRLGLTPADVLHVQWLIAEHLSLYHWAMRRDITDPATLDEVERRVGTLERLRDLYLLTVVDLSTTSPTAMTSWKARMLDDLYLAASARLAGTDVASGADAVRDEAAIGFVGDAGEAELRRFLTSMPERYFLGNPVDVVRAHARLARDRGDQPVFVATLPGSSEDISELVVVTDDRPGALADVAAVLSAHRFDVTRAQIHTRKVAEGRSEAFDVFDVKSMAEGDGEPIDDATLARMRKDLEDLVTGRVRGADLLARRAAPPSWARRRAPAVETQVLASDNVSPEFTVLDVFTLDRPGLLYTIAHTLHAQGLSIALAKVITEGARAADSFYVTDARGAKLGEQVEAVRAALFEAIASLEARQEARA